MFDEGFLMCAFRIPGHLILPPLKLVEAVSAFIQAESWADKQSKRLKE